MIMSMIKSLTGLKFKFGFNATEFEYRDCGFCRRLGPGPRRADSSDDRGQDQPHSG